MRWLAIVALLASCGGSGSKQTAKGAPPAVDEPAPPPAPAETAVTQTPDAGPPPLPAVAGVPALTKHAVAQPRSAEAKKLNTKALGAHRVGNLDEAIASYKAAVAVDAGYLLARYNLASALVTAGEPLQGLYLLQEFGQVGCPKCIERLVRAREDKEWAPLWGDARFDEITHVELDGAYVGVAEFNPGLPDGSAKRLVVKPTIWIDRIPGFATVPPYELVLRGVGGEVSRQPVDTGALKGYRLDAKPIAIPGPGSYALELEAEGVVFAAKTFAVAKKLCYGGRTRLEVLDAPAPRLVSGSSEEEDYGVPVMVGVEGDEDPSFTLDWKVPGFLDGRVYAVIWTRGKKVERKDLISIEGTSTMEDVTRKGDGQCPVRLVSFQLEAPEALHTRPGRWKVGLYAEHGPSYLLSFTLRKHDVVSAARIHVKSVSKLPRVASAQLEASGTMAVEWEADEPYPYGKQVLRAMVRSRKLLKMVARWVAIAKARRKPPAKLAARIRALANKHGGPWKESELSTPRDWFVTARPVAPTLKTRTKRTCLATVCPDYPALSPDGKILAARYYTVVTEDQDGCDDMMFDVVHTFGSPSGASVDMTGFKAVKCDMDDDASLADGHKLEVKDHDGDRTIRILDAKGNEVAKTELYTPALDVCAAPGIRAVVVVAHDNATHCHESPAPEYEVLNY